MPENKANFSTVRERIIDLLRNKRTQFPTLPVIAHNIIEISQDPDTSAKDLAAFIDKDQAIANKVLRMANSPYYGMGRKVDSVLRAITLIGFDEIIGLAVGIGILPSLKTHPIRKIIDMRELWLHSLACCFGARILVDELRATGVVCRQSHGDKAEHSFLPALLHDMGKVLYAIYFPDEYAAVIEKSQRQEVSLCEVEQELLGLDHADFAAELLEYWKFPISIVMPIRCHHAPETLWKPGIRDTPSLSCQLPGTNSAYWKKL